MEHRTARPGTPHSPTLGQLVESYLLHTANTVEQVTFASYATSCRLFVAFAGADQPAENVTDLAIVRWARARLAEGRSPNTVRSELRRLRVFYGWAERRGLVSENWARLAKLPPEPREALRSVSEEQFARLLAYSGGTVTPYRDAALLWLLWDTGMRIGEVQGLSYDQVDMEAMAVHLRAADTKTRAERWVPFTGECKAALYDYLAFERGLAPGPLFLSARGGKALGVQALKHRIPALGRLAGVEVGAHDFRRAFVERCQAKGMPDSLIMQLTGHRSQAMIVRYGRRAAQENAISAYRRAMG